MNIRVCIWNSAGQVGSNVGSQSVNYRVEQLLLSMNLQHHLFLGLIYSGL